MSILDAIPSGQERTAAKQKAEQFLDEKARYFLGPQGYNLASGIVNIPQYLLSAVDIRDYYKSGADLAEKLSKGQFDQSTLESGLDTLGSAAGILIPGVTYRGVKEGFGFLNPFRKNEDFTRGIDFDLKDEISEDELSDTIFYRGESGGRSSEGFGEKDDTQKLVYLSKNPEHAEQYAKDFSVGTTDDSGKAVLDFGEDTQIYKTRIPKDLNLFTYDNPEHIALAASWGKKNQSVLRAKFPTDKRGRKPFDRWLSKLRMGNFDAIEVPEFTDFLRKQGFDGHYSAELYPSKDGPKYATNVAVYNPGNVISEFDPRINKQRVSRGEDFVPDIRRKVDNMFDSMGEEGAMMEYPQIGESLDDYIYNVNRDALRKAEGSEDYPNYLNVLRSNLQQVFPSGKIPVRRTEGYSDVEKKTRQVNEFTVDLENVKFVGNKDERELIMKVDRDKFPDYPHEYMSVRIADDVRTKTEAENFKEGFNIDAFHGTSVDVPIEKLPDDRGYVEGKDIAEFKEFVDQDKYTGDSPALADLGNWFSEDPKTASFFSEQTDPNTFKRGFVPTSRVIPVKLKLENPKVYQTYDELQEEFEDFMEDAISEAGGEIYEDTGTKAFRDMLKRAGHDGIVVTESRTDTGVIRKDFVIFDPKNIRSRFAKFDPKESESADILKKDGGLVSLTHVARDMFRGPQGISSFQQFIAKPQRPMVS